MRVSRIIYLFSILGLLLAACGNSVTLTPSVVPSSQTATAERPTLSVTVTLPPSPSPTHPIATSPAPTLTPTSTITTSQTALDAKGPWLLYWNRSTSNNDLTGLTISNLDGSGATLLNTNEPMETLRLEKANKNGWFSVRAIGSDNEPQIWVFHLPSLKPVRKVSLLSQQATQEIHSAKDNNLFAQVEFSAVTDLTMSWSPDGRYLAFAGALDSSNTDIYIYDTMLDTTKRLTNEPENTAVMDWSPDSRYIVYMVVNKFDWNGAAIQEVRVVRIDALDNKELYRLPDFESKHTLFWEQITAWASNSEFLVQTSLFEDYPRNLRMVNMDTGEIDILYKDINLGNALDPQTKTLYVCSGAYKSGTSATPDKLYRLNLRERIMHVVANGEWYGANWFPQLGQFAASNGEKGRVSFTAQGLKVLQSEGTFLPSPNGKFVLIRKDGHLSLVYPDGTKTQVALTGEPDKIEWMPDSSGFYGISTQNEGADYSLNIFQQSNGWKQELVTSDVELYPGLWIVE